MTLQEKIGQKIKLLRKEKGWSQEELGEKSGLSYKYIGEIERGEVSARITSLKAISSGLGIQLSALFTEKENEFIKETIEALDKLKSYLLSLDSLN